MMRYARSRDCLVLERMVRVYKAQHRREEFLFTGGGGISKFPWFI